MLDDEASEGIDKVTDKAEQSGGVFKTLEDNWIAITAAGVALGAGLMKITGHSHELNEGLRGVSAMTGESEEGLRDMAMAMSDATFSNEDVVRGMESLVQAGYDTQEQFEAMLPVFDNFSDATGTDIVESIKLFDNVLGALGVPLDEAGEHLDTMTYLMKQTDIPISTLERNLGRVPEELEKLGFGLDESSAAIMYFRDQGYTGQEAVREFRRAVEESEGDLESFMEITGMTAEEFERYQKEIDGAAGLTDDLAEINNASLGIWDDLKARLDDAMWSVGTFMEPVKDLGPLMMGIGPAIKGVSVAKGALGVVSLKSAAGVWALVAAKMALLLPIALVVAAIVGLVAIGWYLYNNWEEVTEFVTEIWDTFAAWFTNLWDGIYAFLEGWWDAYWDFWTGAWEGLRDWFMQLWESIMAFISGWWDAFWGFWVSSWEGLRGWFYGLWDGIKGWFAGSLNEVAQIWERTWERISNFFGRIWEGIRDTFFGIWNGLMSGLESGINYAIRGINAFIRTINSAIRGLNKVPGVNISTISRLSRVSIPRLEEGADILGRGVALVGEAGPEIIDLPTGASVRPLPAGGGGINFERGAFEGAFIMDDYGVDRLMDRVVERLEDATGLKNR